MTPSTERDANAQKPNAARQARPEAVAILAAMMVRRAQRQMRERDAGAGTRHTPPPTMKRPAKS